MTTVTLFNLGSRKFSVFTPQIIMASIISQYYCISLLLQISSNPFWKWVVINIKRVSDYELANRKVLFGKKVYTHTFDFFFSLEIFELETEDIKILLISSPV